MVSKLFGLINKKLSSLHEAAILIGLASLASQILGLFRDRLLAHYFGTGETLDIYFAAFKMPDFIFNILAPIVSVTILLPFIYERLGENENKQNTRKLLDSVFTVFFVLVALASLAAYILMPYLSQIVVPGFSGDKLTSFIEISRIMLLSPIILCVSNLLSSITQAYKRFYIYAISPLLYNGGIILGIVLLYPIYGIRGLAYGVIIGALLQLFVQMPSVIKERLLPWFTLNIDWRVIKDVFINSIPRTITLGASALVFIFIVNIASREPQGSISVIQFSNSLQRVPMIIIGVSYSVAAFPTLAKLFSAGERAKFVDQVISATRHIIFWSLPIAGLFIVLRAQIVRSILGTGEFDWVSTRLTAAALAIFAISVVAQSLVQLLVRAFYAGGNTKKPLIASLISSLGIILLAYLLTYIHSISETFSFVFETIFKVENLPGTEVLMLPLAFTIGFIVNLFILWFMFRKDFKEFTGKINKTWRHTIYATIVIGFVTHQFLRVFDNFFDLETLYGVFMQGALSALFGIIAGIFVLKLLKNEELEDLYNALHAKFWKAKPLQPSVEDTSQISG